MSKRYHAKIRGGAHLSSNSIEKLNSKLRMAQLNGEVDTGFNVIASTDDGTQMDVVFDAYGNLTVQNLPHAKPEPYVRGTDPIGDVLRGMQSALSQVPQPSFDMPKGPIMVGREEIPVQHEDTEMLAAAQALGLDLQAANVEADELMQEADEFLAPFGKFKAGKVEYVSSEELKQTRADTLRKITELIDDGKAAEAEELADTMNGRGVPMGDTKMAQLDARDEKIRVLQEALKGSEELRLKMEQDSNRLRTQLEAGDQLRLEMERLHAQRIENMQQAAADLKTSLSYDKGEYASQIAAEERDRLFMDLIAGSQLVPAHLLAEAIQEFTQFNSPAGGHVMVNIVFRVPVGKHRTAATEALRATVQHWQDNQPPKPAPGAGW